MQALIFWTVVVVFIVGQALLIHSAWRLRRPTVELPAGVPRSDARADLAWTLVTATLTALMFYFAYLALP